MPIAKDVVTGTDLHTRMKKGVDKLADAVCCTLGPGGQFVAIETPSGVPHVTKDGYTVAKSIILEDPIENLGAELVKQAAVKQNELSGDGTTTTTCLAQALYGAAVYDLGQGKHPVQIKREMEALSNTVCEMLEQRAVPVTPDDYKKVALVSSNGDEELATMVSDAWKTAGVDGFVLAVPSKNQTTEINMADGYLAEGYAPNVMFLTSRDKGLAEYDDALIVLLTGSRELSLGQLTPMFDMWERAARDRPLVIIAREMKENVLGMLHKNRVESGLKVLPILTDLMDHETFEDLGMYLGCTVFTDSELDFKSAAAMGTLFGEAKKVVYKGRRLSITPKDDHVFSDHYHDRVAMLRDLKSKVGSSEEERNYVGKRLGRMTGGVAVITVGAQTESEAKERKDRFDDAIHAVRASFAKGVLPGAGSTLVKIAQELDVAKNDYACELMMPTVTLFDNAGISYVDQGIDLARPYNLRTEAYDDAVIDPAKVIIDAVRDATSVAVMLIMTNHAVVFNNEALDSFKKKVVDN